MKKTNNIMIVKELIKELKKYDEETILCSGFRNEYGGFTFRDLMIGKTHPIGDRDSEDELILWLGFDEKNK